MKLYLHLGYPKTATTFLQREYFSKSKNINYLGKPFNKKIINLFKEITKKKMSNNIRFKKKYIINNLSKKKINLISQESFFSIFFNKKNHIDTTIKNLKKTLRTFKLDLKIFILIRNQEDLFLSLFTESFLNIKNKYKVDNLEQFIENINDKKFKTFLDNLNFYKRINTLNKTFGTNNVKVFLYEDLKYNFSFFRKTLIKYLCLDYYEEKKYLKNRIVHASTKKNEKYISNETYLISEKLSNLWIYKKLKRILKKNIRVKLKNIFDLRYTENSTELYYKNLDHKKIIKNYFKSENKKINLNKIKLKKFNYI